MRWAGGLDSGRAVVHPLMSVKTIAEFVEYRAQKARRAQLRQSRTGSMIDLSAENRFQAANIQADQCRLQGPTAGPDRPDDQPDAFRDRLDGAGVAAHQDRHREAAGRDDRMRASPNCPTCRRSRKPDYPGRPMCPGTASTCQAATSDALAEKINEAIE